MNKHYTSGLSLVELMIAITIGLFLLIGVLAILLTEENTYSNANGQGAIMDQENALASFIIPVVRGAGFMGPRNLAGTNTGITSNSLNTGGVPPLSTFTSTTATSMIYGYDYSGTASSGATYTLTANPANSTASTNWAPTLDSSLSGQVEPGSDVLIVLGAVPLSQPQYISSITPASLIFTTAQSLTAGQYGFLSNGPNATVIEWTSTTSNSTTGTFATGTSALSNTGLTTLPNMFGGANASQVDTQYLPAQQVAYFVAQGTGGEPYLMSATLNGPTGSKGYSWSVSPLVPGVETIQVLYGIGTGGVITEYLPASTMTALNWTQVMTVRIGFLLQGPPGSSSAGQITNFNVLGTNFTVPADTRLRHVYEMTIAVRTIV